MSKRWEDEEQRVRDGQTMRDALRSVYGDREERHHGTDRGEHHAPWRPDDDDLAILHGKEALRRILADVEVVHVVEGTT